MGIAGDRAAGGFRALSCWRRSGIPLLIAAAIASPGLRAADAPPTLSLSDSLRMALKSNKQLRSYELDPVIAMESLAFQQAIYVPTFSSDASWNSLPGIVAGNPQEDRESASPEA